MRSLLFIVLFILVIPVNGMIVNAADDKAKTAADSKAKTAEDAKAKAAEDAKAKAAEDAKAKAAEDAKAKAAAVAKAKAAAVAKAAAIEEAAERIGVEAKAEAIQKMKFMEEGKIFPDDYLGNDNLYIYNPESVTI